MKTVFIVPVAKNESCDIWGNLRIDPVRIIEERHGEDHIKISIYRYADTFIYGYELKVGSMIRQKLANIEDTGYKNSEVAGIYAGREIETLCNTNKNVKKLFTDFIKIRYNQPELF